MRTMKMFVYLPLQQKEYMLYQNMRQENRRFIISC